MNRKLVAVLAILSIAATGAFAQIGLGVNAALYSDTGMRLSEFGDRLSEGEGVFYGPFIEIAGEKTALGLSGHFSFYDEDWGGYYIPIIVFELRLYLQGHFLGYKSVLDPFLEIGLGVMGKEFADEDNDPDPDNPLMATKYWQVGGGVGINLGGLGIFLKGLYMFPFGSVDASYEYYDEWGDLQTYYYPLSEYPLKRLKLILGAKIIL